eukprot:scaffold49386_cov60-Phaeocystis_antarctica.AAC.7
MARDPFRIQSLTLPLESTTPCRRAKAQRQRLPIGVLQDVGRERPVGRHPGASLTSCGAACWRRRGLCEGGTGHVVEQVRVRRQLEAPAALLDEADEAAEQLPFGAAEDRVAEVARRHAAAVVWGGVAVARTSRTAEHDAFIVSPLALVHRDDLHLVRRARATDHAADNAAGRAVYTAGYPGVATAHRRGEVLAHASQLGAVGRDERELRRRQPAREARGGELRDEPRLGRVVDVAARPVTAQLGRGSGVGVEEDDAPRRLERRRQPLRGARLAAAARRGRRPRLRLRPGGVGVGGVAARRRRPCWLRQVERSGGDGLAAAAQLAAVDERVGHGHDVRRHAVLPAQPADGARVRVGEPLEERDAEAARGGARLAHERRQLVVVAHQHEAAREAKRAEAHRLGGLPCLVHHAHVEGALPQRRVAERERGGAHHGAPSQLALQRRRAARLRAQRVQRVLAQPRVHALRRAEPQQWHAHLVQLEQDVVERRVGVRREQHALAERPHRAHRVRDQRRLARAGHAEDERVVLGAEAALHRLHLLRVERLEPRLLRRRQPRHGGAAAPEARSLHIDDQPEQLRALAPVRRARARARACGGGAATTITAAAAILHLAWREDGTQRFWCGAAAHAGGCSGVDHCGVRLRRLWLHGRHELDHVVAARLEASGQLVLVDAKEQRGRLKWRRASGSACQSRGHGCDAALGERPLEHHDHLGDGDVTHHARRHAPARRPRTARRRLHRDRHVVGDRDLGLVERAPAGAAVAYRGACEAVRPALARARLGRRLLVDGAQLHAREAAAQCVACGG